MRRTSRRLTIRTAVRQERLSRQRGLAIAHQGNGTNAGLELLGGIQTTLESGRAIRFALRFLFAGGHTTTIIMAGIAF